MKLRGIEFGWAFGASGGSNFFGDGWWFDKYCRLIPGYKTDGITEVAKTATLPSRMGKLYGEEGNMNIDMETLQPLEIFPDCIKMYFLMGVMLNAVGLSNPGWKNLLERGAWQKINRPFILSVMCVGKTADDRAKEMEGIIDELLVHLPDFSDLVALEINLSCPNTCCDPMEIAEEGGRYLQIASRANIPRGIKVNPLVPLSVLRVIHQTGLCDFIDWPNTVPWLSVPELIDWKKRFGSTVSPLAKYGGGGYSGPELLDLTLSKVADLRRFGFEMPFIVGGVSHKKDVWRVKEAGGSAIALGRVRRTRPWRVRGIVEEAYKAFGGLI